MKVILRGNLIDVSLIYNITEIIGYDGEIKNEYFSVGKNPTFVVKFIGGNPLVIEDKWVKITTNNSKSEDLFMGKFSTATEYPKWKESYEKLKKTRDKLVKLWVNNQTEIPIIE
jgi:hypothetical protein